MSDVRCYLQITTDIGHRTSSFMPPIAKEMQIMIRFRSLMAVAALCLAGTASTAADPGLPGACCDSGCQKVCVRGPETKKVVKRVYTDLWEPLCLPKCSILGHLLGQNER